MRGRAAISHAHLAYPKLSQRTETHDNEVAHANGSVAKPQTESAKSQETQDEYEHEQEHGRRFQSQAQAQVQVQAQAQAQPRQPSTVHAVKHSPSNPRPHDPAPPCPPNAKNALLAQVPLTVSPFVTLPKAPTLPHNYASLPSTLPPSILNTESDDPNAPPAYVTSGTGFRAHPSAIIAQNKALRDQLDTAASDARKQIREWHDAINERELAEKRRKAPGWLDSDAKILRPATTVPPPDPKPGASLLDVDDNNADALRPQESGNDMGSQMDRAFG
ncbi:hypothetical protein E4T43_08295 [Aureobasidium subglaciale]|nr:hypothetical protein E4T43_08295 [Aureobasidium subglaciale]